MVKDPFDAAFAACAETIEIGASDHHSVGPQRTCLHHVAASPYPTVTDNRDAAAYRVDDVGEQLDGREGAVGLAATVVGRAIASMPSLIARCASSTRWMPLSTTF